MRHSSADTAGSLTAAIVGFGQMARFGHLPWFERTDLVRLVAVVDPCAEARALARALRPAVAVHATLPDLLDSERPVFVDIVSPPAAHAGSIVNALASGIHVFCEKPFVTSIEALAEIDRRRRASGLLVAACHNWYFAPAISRALELFERKSIGDALSLTFTAERVRAPAGAPYGKRAWRLSAAEGGGIIGDLGYHGFYLANRVMGGRPAAVRVLASVAGPHMDSAENHASIELAYSGGRVATVELSWGAPIKRTEVRIVGRSGTIVLDNDELRMRAAGGETLERVSSLVADSWHAAWTDGALNGFVDALRNGEYEPAWQDIDGAVTALCASLSQVRAAQT